jgi:large subunit ribosomal protein L7A
VSFSREGFRVPLNELAVANRLIGVRTVRKALADGRLKKLFLAEDARRSLICDLEAEAREAGVQVEWVEAMVLLGRACAISRGAAAAGIEGRKGAPARSDEGGSQG